MPPSRVASVRRPGGSGGRLSLLDQHKQQLTEAIMTSYHTWEAHVGSPGGSLGGSLPEAAPGWIAREAPLAPIAQEIPPANEQIKLEPKWLHACFRHPPHAPRACIYPPCKSPGESPWGSPSITQGLGSPLRSPHGEGRRPPPPGRR
jgi:hypothetical protein